jgi:hypothetical protein
MLVGIIMVLILMPHPAWAQSTLCMTLPAEASTAFQQVRDSRNSMEGKDMTDDEFVNNTVRNEYMRLLQAMARRAGTTPDLIDLEAIPELGILNRCGDGTVGGAEECDSAGESAACDRDCTSVSCGDGYTNTTAGEACDGGVGCNPDCTLQ